MPSTPHLGLNIPEKTAKGKVVTEVFDPNFTKIDQFAERVDTNKLDKGVGLKSSNAREIEELIENLITEEMISGWNVRKIVGSNYYEAWKVTDQIPSGTTITIPIPMKDGESFEGGSKTNVAQATLWDDTSKTVSLSFGNTTTTFKVSHNSSANKRVSLYIRAKYK